MTTTLLLLASVLCTAPDEDARTLLDAAGVKGGLVVHLGCGDGALTAALGESEPYTVHGLDASAKNVDAARARILSLGRYGRIAIDRLEGNRLPYIDNLVTLVLSADPGEVTDAEILRVVRPGGVAYVKRGGEWKRTVKPRPEGMDDWGHYLHDPGGNAVSHDTGIAPLRRSQWVGSPRWTRHHDRMSSISGMVTAGGRMFYIFDEGQHTSIALPPEWTLVARDAFNGAILWKHRIPKWHSHLYPLKSGPATLPRRLVATEKVLYATLGLDAPVTALDAETGEILRTCEGTRPTEEILHSNGVLFLLVANAAPDPATGAKDLNETRRLVTERPWDGKERNIVAVRAATGEILWKRPQTALPMTLAADANHVYCHNGKQVVAIDRGTGETAWTSEPVERLQKILSWFAPTLVVYDGVVLFAGGAKVIPHRGGDDMMTALDAGTGKVLWNAKHPPSGYQSPEDILVAGGLVWTAPLTSGRLSGVWTGRDPKTGEVKKEFPPDVETYWFHHRCYKARATDKYLLPSRTGIEFVDHEKEHWEIHHWVRGGCLYGIMPANGMIYTPPHPCACYPEAKLFGFNALAPGPVHVEVEGARLEKGPAHGEPAEGEVTPDDWPTYRHDARRSARTDAEVPTDLAKAWDSRVGGRLSALSVAGDRVFVASIDRHTLHALDAKTGKPLWMHQAGGRIDSPPTVHKGLLLFGSADGRVTCLRASDGALVWRFRAAPSDRRHMAFEQVESVWPVHGTILVINDEAQFVAGRSMFLDGGLRFFRLQASTGKLISETVLDDKDPATGKSLQEKIQTLQMPVALPDVLSSDGGYVYMRSQMFDLEGRRLEIGPTSGNAAQNASVQRGPGAHLFSPIGFLDGSWWHRAYWVYGKSFSGGHNGYYQAGKFAPSGRIITFDDRNVYGFRRKPEYLKWTTPLEHHLYSAPLEAPDVPAANGAGTATAGIPVENSPSLNPNGKPLTVEAWVQPQKQGGVVIARGGSRDGYALVVDKGFPVFMVRSRQKLGTVAGTDRITGKWTHLAGTLAKDGTLAIYVNGKPAGSKMGPGLLGSEPANALEIGADASSPVGNYTVPLAFTGMIDEVKVWHSLLAPEEIAEHADHPGSRKAADGVLAASWTFDQGDARDDSGNKNHGKLGNVQPGPGRVGAAMRFRRKGGGNTRGTGSNVKYHWAQDIPLFARAMVMADRKLFVVGPRDLINEEEVYGKMRDPETQKQLDLQVRSLQGKEGALLWVVSPLDGEKLGELRLDVAPVWDGMAAARGKLYIATLDGRVVCLSGR